jgi:hypothetical protein
LYLWRTLISSTDRHCKQELWEILKHFAKDKIPGPDGWTVEFFTQFFEVVGDDLLELAEDTRIRGKIKISLNTTFLGADTKGE